ncbi:MAG: PstS family phosphate ABC transporter substrate-binding protein [Candidatus Peregrinibacteria bacterium]|nr:PstS family phosphate ABC transporter substrate-binding protein [Candidatus Peregrinibacteria bacterium]
MKSRAALLLLPLISLAACSPGTQKSTVEIDGSSTVFPITEAMAEEFQKANPDTQVVVGISGTGGGFERFCRGETHINDASRPIKAAEATACTEKGIEYIELPIAYDGLAVMVHPSNDWVDYLTVAELKKMWEPEAQNTVMRWNQIRPEWPDEPLSLYGAGVDSGTYDYFTQAIVGKEGSSRGDFVSSEDDNVLVQGIASDPNALGFFGYAYYDANKEKLKLIPIAPGAEGTAADAILPAPATINDGYYQPLSRPIFIYVSRSAADDAAVASFVSFYIDPTNAEKLVSEVQYVPLPEELYTVIRKRFQERTIGSIFENAGSQVGVTLEELLNREAR